MSESEGESEREWESPSGARGLRWLLFQLAFSNLWLTGTAAGFTLAASVLLGWRLSPLTLGLPALSLFAVYTFDKVFGFDPVADTLNDPERSAFIARFGRALVALALVGLAAGSVLALRAGGGLALGLLWAPIGVGLLYGFKLLPPGLPVRRLKDITGGKNLSVGLTWGLCCVHLPATLLGAPWEPGVWASAGLMAGHMVWNSLYFDLGDLEGDAREGVKTIPVVLGHSGAWWTLCAGTAALLLGAGALWPLGMAPAGLLGFALSSAALQAWALHAARAPEADLGFACDIGIDGCGMLGGGVALLASIALG